MVDFNKFIDMMNKRCGTDLRLDSYETTHQEITLTLWSNEYGLVMWEELRRRDIIHSYTTNVVRYSYRGGYEYDIVIQPHNSQMFVDFYQYMMEPIKIIKALKKFEFIK